MRFLFCVHTTPGYEPRGPSFIRKVESAYFILTLWVFLFVGDEVPGEDDDDASESPFEPEDITEPPVVEHITVPSGKPFVEVYL